jgi:regulator of replication initiation timing
MHKTKAGERRKTLKIETLELARDAKVLQKAAKTLPEAGHEAQRLQEDADKALVESEVLKLQARLEDLTVWEMEKTKSTKKGTKTYTYWMVSWREGEKVRNVHLGSSRKMDAEAAKQKARKMKAEALGWSQ